MKIKLEIRLGFRGQEREGKKFVYRKLMLFWCLRGFLLDKQYIDPKVIFI